MKTRSGGWTVAGIIVVTAACRMAFGDPVQAKSTIDSVTLYRNQALVTRVVRGDVPAGITQLLVGDLPERIAPASLFAEAAEGTQVRAVRYRIRAVRDEPREEVRELDRQIDELGDEVKRIKAGRRLLDQRSGYLAKLEQFTAPTAQVELTKGVLDAQTLKTITLLIFEQRGDVAAKKLELELKERELNRQVELLQRQCSKHAAGRLRTVQEAVVFVNRPEAGRAELRLSYLVAKAGWEPAYNLRASVNVEYNATVHQMSGEDWSEVKLRLSTASMALVAWGPELAPFWVTLSQAPRGESGGGYGKRSGWGEDLPKQAEDFQRQLRQSQELASNVMRLPEQVAANLDINRFAGNLQLIEMQASEDEMRMICRAEAGALEGMSVTYSLPGRASLESRSDRQLVQSAALELKSSFYYVATPVLSGFVYREAEIANDGPIALLAGPATVYLDGQFVGRGNASGQASA